MTFEEFLTMTYGILRQAKGADGFWLPESYLKEKTHEPKALEKRTRAKPHDFLTFYNTWSMGTYDSDEKTIVDPEIEAEDPIEFDTILTKICPDMRFLEYRVLHNEVFKRGEYTESDWYGGAVNEGYKGFNIKDLYEALLKRGLV